MQSLQALGSEKWLSTQFRFQSIADNETFYIFATLSENARVAELVDALDSKSSFFGSAGSIPALGTKRELLVFSSIFPVLFFSLIPADIRNNEFMIGVR